MSEKQEKPRRFIWQTLEDIRSDLKTIKRGLEIMAQQSIVSHSELEQIKYQVASLAEGLGEIESRVIKLETQNTLERWVLRQGGTILLVILAAYLASRFF